MNDLIQQFAFRPEGSKVTHKVRTVTREGEPWFVPADVCSVLEIAQPHHVAARLDEDEKGRVTVTTPGGPQEVTIVNESGLWSLVLTSRKPEAKAFKKWLTSVVIPAIRKTGSYVVGEEMLAEAQTVQDLDAINEVIQEALKRKAALLEEKVSQQALMIQEQAPKV